MTSVFRVTLCALAALGLSAHLALAHSTKQATRPADGAVLTATPDTVGMTFDMPMRVTLISLIDQDGTPHALTRQDDMQPVTEFDAIPPTLPNGTYKVDWRGLAADGHPMQGSFTFEVAQ